jgi:hypothetical protein
LNVKKKKPSFSPGFTPLFQFNVEFLDHPPVLSEAVLHELGKLLRPLVHDRLALPMDKEVELQAVMMPMASRTYPETRSHFSMALFLWGWEGI